MKVWEEIVNKATLGTGKQPLQLSDLPGAIASTFDVQEIQDAEENFFRLSALAFQYRQAGTQPLNFSSLSQAVAEAEVKTCATARANATLKMILDEEHYHLLELWLKQCVQKGWCVEPAIIPQLFDIALRKKELRQLIINVVGKRGEWLSGFNNEWNFYLPNIDETTLWETGRPDERKAVLRSLREHKPQEAIELLKSTWATEGVNEKVSFLETLKVNLSSFDLAWLESLNEKGQKVNNAINDLLKLIPESAIQQAYCDILKNAVAIKTGKALLGMINKKTITVNESISFPDSIFKTGIEKLSSDKNVSDNQYILVQLICAVPPSFWNEHLHESPKDIIQLIQKEQPTALYLPALAIAAVRFKNNDWIKNILDHGDDTIMRSSIIALLRALPGEARDRYARKFFNLQPADIIQVMLTTDREWSLEFAKAVIKFTANEVYSYNKNFYSTAVAFIPTEISNVLDSFIPAEEQKRVYWKTQSDELSRLLSIKHQTLQSFIS